MRPAHATLLFAYTALAAANLTGQEPYHPSPFGAVVVLRQNGKGHDPIEGELIAATADSVWVLQSATLRSVPLESIRRVEFTRFESGASTAWTWGLVAGVLSAGALYAACSSVEGTDNCGILFPVVMAPWVIFAGVGAASLSGSSVEDLPATADALRPYSRFPQGLPPGMDGATLRVGVSLPLPRR